MDKRQCGSCTKCCEGYLEGSVLGHSFFPGKPCHFVTIGQGCTQYAKRPKDPCQVYKCSWVTDMELPEWMKPDKINAIVDVRDINGIAYLQVHETGGILRSDVLSWLIKYVLLEPRLEVRHGRALDARVGAGLGSVPRPGHTASHTVRRAVRRASLSPSTRDSPPG